MYFMSQVDNNEATVDNIIHLLVGSDIPGSIVTIKYRRGDAELSQTLIRVSTVELADKTRLFQLL